MPRIKVTPEQIRQMGQRFHTAGQESQDLVRSLQSQVSSVAGDWEGMTKERFYCDFQEWQVAMRDFVEMLFHINQELNTIAERFQQADQA